MVWLCICRPSACIRFSVWWLSFCLLIICLIVLFVTRVVSACCRISFMVGVLVCCVLLSLSVILRSCSSFCC